MTTTPYNPITILNEQLTKLISNTESSKTSFGFLVRSAHAPINEFLTSTPYSPNNNHQRGAHQILQGYQSAKTDDSRARDRMLIYRGLMFFEQLLARTELADKIRPYLDALEKLPPASFDDPALPLMMRMNRR